jgi:hypothetical protein
MSQHGFVGPDGQVYYFDGAWGLQNSAGVDRLFAVQK